MGTDRAASHRLCAIAGLPPQAGILAAFAAPLGYALFGTSRQLVASPTSATAAISATLVAPIALGNVDDFARTSAALAILCGVAFLICGWLKLGFVSQFIAPGVQIGFLFGLGLTIALGQLFTLLGNDKTVDGPFYDQLGDLLANLDETHWLTLVLGVVSLLMMLMAQRIAPTVPTALILIVIAIAVVSIFDLADRGVTVVGDVDRIVPTPALPLIPLDDWLALVPGTLAIVVIGYSESMAVSRRMADEHRYPVNSDRELIALGVSSLFAGVFKGFIASGGASQTASNDRAGARSQVSSLVLSAMALLTALALMPLFRNLPLAVLAAIVINAVLGFVDVPAMARVRHLRSDSFALA